MKYISIYCSAFLSVVFGSLSWQSSAQAAAFDQQELDQSKVIAVAVPLPQGGRYNLLVLEQLNNSRACWQETSSPGVIDPLLLKFDFTNICGRSTDSNGYSVRISGQDRGMDYRLSVARVGNRLVLQGVPSRGNRGAVLNIAQADAAGQGFLKLNLNSGWRFTKRSYQGKTLGHIYLTRDTQPGDRDNAIAENSSAPARLTSETATQPSRSSRIWTSRRNPQTSTVATRPRRTTALAGPVTIPVPSPKTTSALASTGSFPPPMRSGSGELLPVPSGNIPLGNAGNEPDLITASNAGNIFGAVVSDSSSPPPPMRSMLGMPRYRLFVDSNDAAMHRKARVLVKDAFRSNYRGQRYLQVGAFKERSEADPVISLLSSNGIPTKLIDESPN
jgi:hypothetical protein